MTMALTVGDLCASHIGVTMRLTPPPDLSGHAETFVDVMARVQHNAPSVDPLGEPVAAQTLLAFGAWSGPLDPSWPIEIVED